MIVDEIQIPLNEARTLLLAHGSVRKAIEAYKK
jgi:hypothetical protein